MKKYLLLFLSILCIIYVFSNFKETENIIPDDAIRFRVIANSNSINDQNVKIQVRNVVQNKIFELISGVDNIDKTRKILQSNIDEINKLVKDTLNKLGYNEKFNVNYGYNYFPKKKYKGITYKEGKYESLVITLGNGDGDNWWCVLFPPLCLLEADESNSSDAEYTFFVKELIEKYIKK